MELFHPANGSSESVSSRPKNAAPSPSRMSASRISTDMQPGSDRIIGVPGMRGLRARTLGEKVTVVAALTLVYVTTFRLVIGQAGPVGAALISIPVAAAGWYFGISTGIAAGVFGVLLSAVLLNLLEGAGWLSWAVNYWPGNLMVVVVGYLAGHLHVTSYEQAHLASELRSRERFLTLINLTTRNILNPADTNETDANLLAHLVDLFTADHACLTRWDAATQRVNLVASTLVLERPHSTVVLDPRESTVIARVLQGGRVLAVSDLPHSPLHIGLAALERHSPPIRSILGIPLKVGGFILGVLVIAFDSPHAITAQELRYAELAGDQVALALWAVQQELKIQRRFAEANALAGIERVLSETERVGVETVLQLIVDSAKKLIVNAQHVILHLLDNEQQILVPRAVAGYTDVATGRLNMRLGEGVAGRVIETGVVISIPDVLTDPRFVNQVIPVKFRSLIVVPVESNERRVGTISVQSDRPDAFDVDEIQLLTALGTQAAIAIENANLMQTTRERLKEINALYRINQSLAVSLEPDQLMKDVVHLLQEDFGFSHVHIYMADPQTGDFVLREATG